MHDVCVMYACKLMYILQKTQIYLVNQWKMTRDKYN